jgi:hypothetical protein
MFDVVQGEALGLWFVRILGPHPQASILEEAARGVCSLMHTSAPL